MKRAKNLIPMLLIGAMMAAGITANAATDNKDKDKDKKEFAPSHVQVGTIDVCKGDKSLGFNAFCLDSSGNLLCAVGQSVAVYGRTKETKKVKQGIRVFNPDGEMTAFWPLEFTPQAIGYGPDNHIYVGGEGKIAKLNRNGDIVKQTDAPNLQNRDELIAKLKKEHLARIEQTKKSYASIIKRTTQQIEDQKSRLEKMQESPEAFAEEMKKSAQTEIKTNENRLKSYESMITRYKELVKKANDQTKAAYENAIANYERQIKSLTKRIETLKKGADVAADEKQLKARLAREVKLAGSRIKNLERTLATYKKYLENNSNPEISEMQIENMLKQKSKISSISATGDNVFVVCQASEGYGFDVWKSGRDFSESKKIVKGLRGCCGQMDVQACKKGLYVAENTGHRVVQYDLDGKKLTTFGKRDAKGENGFGSCCNPMNVCFAKGDTVLTAESGTGRIMQFNDKGEKIGVIGNGQITGGCKNVAVHATHDLQTVYMLDLTGKKVCVLKPKNADGSEEE